MRAHVVVVRDVLPQHQSQVTLIHDDQMVETFAPERSDQRLAVLRELGWPTAPCFCWPCDDASALILLATIAAGSPLPAAAE